MALEPLEKRRGSGSRESGGDCSRRRGLSVPNKIAAKGMAHLNLLRKGAGSEAGNLAGFTAVIAGCLSPIKVTAKGMGHFAICHGEGFCQRASSS